MNQTSPSDPPQPSEWHLDDAAAEFFEAHFVPALFAAWAPVLLDAAGVARGQQVLDVACGTGIVARTAAERLAGSGAVTGLDLNPSMIKVARRLQPDVVWHEGDATQLPLADASFDAVLCQAGLMFFPEPVVALTEMRRVLRPGGTLAALVWGPSAGYAATAELLEAACGQDIADIFRAPFCLASPDRTPELFVAAGFASPASTTFEQPARFPSVEAFLRTEVDGWVLKGRVDIEALIPAARERLAAYVEVDGTLAIPMAAHVVTATKA